MNRFEHWLAGSDLRSLGNSESIIDKIRNQADFDALFALLFHADRVIVMRAADVIEKITVLHPAYLQSHRVALLSLCKDAENKELKWHLAQLLPRLILKEQENTAVWDMLKMWAADSEESKIVRVNAIQGLFDMAQKMPAMQAKLLQLLHKIEKEGIPSLNARIRILNAQLPGIKN